MNEASLIQTGKPTRAANVTLYESAFGGGKIDEAKDVWTGRWRLFNTLGVPP
jgi:hypothetical protein